MNYGQLPPTWSPVLCISCSFRDAGGGIPTQVEQGLERQIQHLDGSPCRVTRTTWLIATRLKPSQVVDRLMRYFGKGDVLTVFPVAVGREWSMTHIPFDDREEEQIDGIAVWMQDHIRQHHIVGDSITSAPMAVSSAEIAAASGNGLPPISPSQLRISCGPVDFGWADFAVSLDSHEARCSASYLGYHPLQQLIPLCLDIASCFARPLVLDDDDLRVDVIDEPGGLAIVFKPHPKEYVDVDVRLREITDGVGDDREESSLFSGTVRFRDLAAEIFREATENLRRHGFVGLRRGWEPRRWDCDSPRWFFPIEAFLLLRRLLDDNDADAYSVATHDEDWAILNGH